MKCRYLSLSLFALFASLFMAFSITNGDSFASSWSYTFPANSMTATSPGSSGYNLSSLGFDSSFVPVYYTLTYSPSLGHISQIVSVSLFIGNFYSSYGQSAFYLCQYNNNSNSCSSSSERTIFFSSNLSTYPSSLRIAFYSDRTISFDITLTISDTVPDFGSGGGITPSGSLSITENGTYDVTNYAQAVVDVSPEIIQGDYHNDLQELKQAAILVPAVLLLIYFFWAIYKMIMGGVRR